MLRHNRHKSQDGMALAPTSCPALPTTTHLDNAPKRQRYAFPALPTLPPTPKDCSPLTQTSSSAAYPQSPTARSAAPPHARASTPRYTRYPRRAGGRCQVCCSSESPACPADRSGGSSPNLRGLAWTGGKKRGLGSREASLTLAAWTARTQWRWTRPS